MRDGDDHTLSVPECLLFITCFNSVVQARKRGLDQGEVRGEEVLEENDDR